MTSSNPHPPPGSRPVEPAVLLLARLVLEAAAPRPVGPPGASPSTGGATVGRASEPGRPRRPYLVGITGGVAVGKSTIAAQLETAIREGWPTGRGAGASSVPVVEVVATDGFLWPNEQMAAQGLAGRKGFPESYDDDRLTRFVQDLTSGRAEVEAPVYSHETYDVVPGARHVLRSPDVVIVEGLHLLLPGMLRHERSSVADHLDFTVYVEAPPDAVRHWYLERVMELWASDRRQHRSDPRSDSRFGDLDGPHVRELALQVWTSINEVNFHDHIEATRDRADAIVTKGIDHHIEAVDVRRDPAAPVEG